MPTAGHLLGEKITSIFLKVAFLSLTAEPTGASLGLLSLQCGGLCNSSS